MDLLQPDEVVAITRAVAEPFERDEAAQAGDPETEVVVVCAQAAQAAMLMRAMSVDGLPRAGEA